ncbi:MAG: hypothetical protein ACP5JG_13235 [Anaerolineae bacterium]
MALRTLYQALLDSEPARLRVIAQQWAIPLTSGRRADIAAELVDAMATAESVERRLTQLTPEQRSALNDLLRNDGTMPWPIFIRRWGEVRAVGAGRIERDELWRDPVSSAEALWHVGLVQRAFDERGGQPVEMAFVPEELALYMPRPQPLDIPAPPAAAAPAPYEKPGEDTLCDDLVTLWAAIQQEDSPEEIHPPAVVRAALVTTLSVEHGWLRQDGDGRLRPIPNAILAWLRSDPWSQWSALVRAWMESERWHDIAYVPELAPDPVHDWPSAPLASRRALLEMLRKCEPDTWYDIVAFRDYVRAHATDYLRPDGNYHTWAPRDARTDKPLRGFEAWDSVEGALVNFIITGPLTWLGLVDVGLQAEREPPVKFRLNEAGAALLGTASPPSLSKPGPVQVDRNGTLIVPRRRRYERFQLNRIAASVGSAGSFRYQLTPASLRSAKRQRISLDRIIAFLEEAAENNLPAHLQAAIARAYRQGAGASLEEVWLLRVPDSQLLQSPEMRELIVEHLGPELAIIQERDRELVARILLKNQVLTDSDLGRS